VKKKVSNKSHKTFIELSKPNSDKDDLKRPSQIKKNDGRKSLKTASERRCKK